MPEHGGKLLKAAKKYNIPMQDWIDLSSGINPISWIDSNNISIPAKTWQRLPENEDDLLLAASKYYGTEYLLPTAGSQPIIQLLPYVLPNLRTQANVAILKTTYNEHPYHWQKAGHNVIRVESNDIDNAIDKIDVLILCNPNNPTGEVFSKDKIEHWHKTLVSKNGWLIIDEAFVDTHSEHSLAKQSGKEGLVILRSLGKFFGLAGARVGFVLAQKDLLETLDEKLGPWTISNPSRLIATLALQDFDWHKKTKKFLNESSLRLKVLLTENGLSPTGSTDYFQWIKFKQADKLHESLAKQGILTRLFTGLPLESFDQELSVRFGLPADENEWNKLSSCISQLFLVR